ncbi:hypothetical protein THAOC_15196 [Thalassiosira oceanica]|uniref:Cyclin-like domain-containing protein n=1 Tax=Thalassiosira oceanica TaxID=159749 RepID=K0T0X5_THAOC|nr:hypothetical protein THAOC_15196 [Thalassiosira oceanica]|eukprot:EJK64102.1 hypothetical protein THAOC_15196 [Thalassiosira oceanica]
MQSITTSIYSNHGGDDVSIAASRNERQDFRTNADMRQLLYLDLAQAAEGTSPRTVHVPTTFSNMRDLLQDPIQAAQSLAALLEKETVYARGDYLADRPPRGVSANDRLLLVEWMYSGADQCGFKDETAAIAMELVDRFLSSCSHKTLQYYLVKRERFQLLAVAAYYVSVKTTEKVTCGSDLLALVSCGTYTKEEIERTERELLIVLRWRINPPTVLQFGCLIMSLVVPHVPNIHGDLVAKMLDETAYQAENSVRDYSLSQERSSSIAVAALFNAADQELNSDIRREFLLALSWTLVGNFAHPKELRMARLRLQSEVDSCGTTNGETAHHPNRDNSDDAQFITAFEVGAVLGPLNGCMPVKNDIVYNSWTEKPTFFDASSLEKQRLSPISCPDDEDSDGDSYEDSFFPKKML